VAAEVDGVVMRSTKRGLEAGRAAARAVAAAAVALALVACDSQEVRQSGVMGVNGQVGDVLLRSVHIEAPPQPAYRVGSDARVWFTVINSGPEPDALVAVTSPVAAAVEIRWDDDCDGRFDTVPALPLAPAEPAVVDPTGAAVPFDAYHLRLRGFTRDVIAGTNVEVTFRFRRAGPVTLWAFVQPSNAPRAEPSNRCAR
jgi:copper(I)-binding protein